MKTHRYCPKCNTQLRNATKWWEKLAGYQFICDKCDENFFSFETVTLKELKRNHALKNNASKH